MTIGPYREYADHGIAWVGTLPTHWGALPNRALFEEVKSKNHPEEPMLSVTIDRGVIRQSELLADTTKKDSSNENKSNYKLVVPGDLAYNKMRAWQGSIGVSRYRGIVSPAYVILRLRNAGSPTYYHYLFRTPAFAKEAERLSYGISSDQWSLRWEDFKRIYCPVPPPDEQDLIVRFLVHKDREVAELLTAYRRLVGVSKSVAERKQSLVNEYRTRLITEVVTGKIDVQEISRTLPEEEFIDPMAVGIDEMREDDQGNAVSSDPAAGGNSDE